MSSNTNSGFCRRWSSDEEDDKDNTTESHQIQVSLSVYSSHSRILDIQRNKWDAMIHQTEKLWKSDNARRDAVLARLKRLAQQDFLPSSQLQTDPRHKPESSVPRYKLGTVLSLLSNDEEGVSNSWTTKTQRLQQSGKIQDAMTQEANKSWRSTSASVTSEDSFSSQNTHSPSEPRTSPLIENTTPHLPLAPQRQKRSRLPVLMMHPNSEDKEVAGGRNRIQTVRPQVEGARLQHLYEDSIVHLPQAPAATRKPHMTVMTQVIPVHSPQPSPHSKTEIHCWRSQHPAKTPEMLQPLANPVASLSLCLKLLNSRDWEKKLEGLLTVRALTQHHPDKLKEKVYVVCLAVIAEVKNLLPSVACAATDTIVYLAVYLRRAMDTHVEKAGSALLLRITQPPINFSIRKKIHTALEALVQNCSPVQVLNVLVNKGLGHLSAAVRATTAQQLHLLVDRLGAKAILSAGKNFTERFIHAVRKISLDKAPDVRPHGLAILHQLGPYSDFTKLWTKAIEDKDRYDLQKVLRNAMQQSTRSKSLEESGDKKTKSRGV
ncbi:hypothetical protein Q8A73_022227 [Channa argus]|nr:hypothetical protein Q8A73_022227 [Channa argus]